MGGADYIVKPFSLPQLRARIEAHLRREQRTPVKRLRSGDCCFDLAGKELYVGENRVRLTKSEFALAEQLAGHPGLVYTREQLLESAFGYETESDEAAGSFDKDDVPELCEYVLLDKKGMVHKLP